MHDWRKAVRAPISYTVPGSSSALVQRQTNFVSFVIITGACILFLLNALLPQPPNKMSLRTLDEEHGHEHGVQWEDCRCSRSELLTSFNRTYPLTPIEPLPDGRLKYKIAVVADLDKSSKLKKDVNQWFSYILYGELVLDPQTSKVEITWQEKETELSSQFNSGGRGMELSELAAFNGKLYTCDDRTGIVYEVNTDTNMLVPWVILSNGNGHNQNGFKCEWMVTKDRHLYVGGLGKEWTSTTGDVVLNHDPQWVKRISLTGQVEHQDWRLRYIQLRQAAGIEPPGYLIHEAITWSDHAKQWIVLPRRASHEAYDDHADERRGTNILLTANENFNAVNLSTVVGPLIPTHGFSSVKIVPLPSEVQLTPAGTEIAIALKSEEDNDTIATYVTVFRLPDGHVLLPERRLSSRHKYEGIEFI